MNKKFGIFIIAVSLILCNILYSQIPECMCPPLLYPLTGQLINQDSAIVIDTCGIWYPSANCDSAYFNNIKSEYWNATKYRVYAKEYFEIVFEDVEAILIPVAPKDSIIEVTWQAIDSINYPDIYEGFKAIEEKYGNYILIKIFPTIEHGHLSQIFDMHFTNLVKVQEVEDEIRNIPYSWCEFKRWPMIWASNIYDKYLSLSNNLEIYPNPCSYYIKIISQNKLIHKAIIRIYSIYGEYINKVIIKEENQEVYTLDISELENGIYFLCINNNCRKFIVLR